MTLAQLKKLFEYETDEVAHIDDIIALLEEQEMQENESNQLEKKISLDDFEVDKTTDIQVGEPVTMTFTAGDKILKELNIKIKFTKVVKVYNKG